MNKPRMLVMAAAGVILSVLLTVPAMADSSGATVTQPDIESQTVTASISDADTVPEEAGDFSLEGQAAVPYPTDIQLVEQADRNYLYKTYTVAANYDPDLLVEPAFSQGGYRYRFSEIIQRSSTPASASKTVTEYRTVDSATGDEAAILAMLGSKLPYTDSEGYRGELFLVPESLMINASGQTAYSYTVTETKRYENLSSNDMAAIPKTATKNGMTLQLQSVDWQATGNQDMGYSGIPSGYTAVALYSAPATGTKASGYTATATFTGEAVKELIGKNTYTIVYEGEQIVIPFNFIPLLIAGAIVACGIIACIVLWKMRRNVTIYTLQQGVPEFYAKVRVNRKKPVLDLSRVTDVGVRLVFDKRFVKSLYDQKVFVVGRYENYRINLTGSLVQELPAQTPPDNKAPGAGQPTIKTLEESL